MIKSSVFTPESIIVQGITGSHGSFHTLAMKQAGINIVAGTSPNKAGTFVHDIPVYSSINAIQTDFSVDASVIFVPAPFAKAAILEAIDAHVPLIVCITEGIPIHDMLEIKRRLKNSESILVGPNCPGLLIPGVVKLGIIPAELGMPGSIGLVSRSGTLTYEAAAGLTRKGIGQKYIIGIGGDPVHGLGFIDSLSLFENDPEVEKIILIGEIGGDEELQAAEYIKQSVTKPVYGYITGHYAPKNVQLGHAGAILGSENESADAKTKALEKSGVTMASSVSKLIDLLG